MRYFNHIIITMFLSVGLLHAQMIHRYGTTTGNFLEIGVDSEGSAMGDAFVAVSDDCLLYTSPSPRDLSTSRMPSSA